MNQGSVTECLSPSSRQSWHGICTFNRLFWWIDVSPDSRAGPHETAERPSEHSSPMNADQGPTQSQHAVWRLHKSDYAATFQSPAAARFKDYAKEDGSASLSYCNLLLYPSCSPAGRDFPSAKEASARFPLLNIQQQNQKTTCFRVIEFSAATRATLC